MAPIYPFDLYDLIEAELRVIQEKLATISDNSEKQFETEKHDALAEFRQFLSDAYDMKLPKRLRKQLKT